MNVERARIGKVYTIGNGDRRCVLMGLPVSKAPTISIPEHLNEGDRVQVRRFGEQYQLVGS